MKTVKDLMLWRYACQHFDAEKKLSADDLRDLLETAHLSPSSFGLQAWKIVVINNSELREKLAPVCNDQPQITEASVLVLFCARTDLQGKKGVIQRYTDFYREVRGKTAEQAETFRNKVSKYVEDLGSVGSISWLKNQVYLPAETLMMAAAEKKIDSCPMEGFESSGVSKVLELPKNLLPVIMVALGYRKNPEQPKKVRLPLNEIVEFRE